MKYQSWFYYRSDNPDAKTHLLMQSIADVKRIEELYVEMFSNTTEEDTYRLTFEYHILDNLEERKDKLKAFIKSARQSIKIQPIRVEGVELSFPFDYVQSGNKKVAPETLFAQWDHILKVHKTPKLHSFLTLGSMVVIALVVSWFLFPKSFNCHNEL